MKTNVIKTLYEQAKDAKTNDNETDYQVQEEFLFWLFDYGHLGKLIERVQELEGDAENIYRANHYFSRRNDALIQQNKRYREYLGRLQRATKRYPAEDMAYVVNKITNEALEDENE